MPRAAARASDRLLDVLLVAFAGWTAVYHVCLLAGIGAGWAGAGGLVALVLALWFVLRGRDEAPTSLGARTAAGPRATLLAVNAVLAVAAGAAFGLTRIPYLAIWLLWIASATCSVLWCASRLRPAGAGAGALTAPAQEQEPPVRWFDLAVVAAWAIALAVVSLVIRDPDPDDSFYVHVAAWIGAHGVFPTRDVVYSNQVFPALYFPPVFSYEALTGTLARFSGLSVADLQYLVVTPAGTVLSVLAIWRLLRAWRVPMVALALTAALVFLAFDAAHHMTFGAFFANRMWQGKVLLLSLGVPLLFALLHDYVDRPDGRRLALLFAAGAAAVGLSTTGIFLVPVIAGGSLLTLLLRRPRREFTRVAALGFAAAGIYPIAAGAVTKLAGGRTPDVYTAADVIPSTLVHYVLGTGGFAMLALAAVLVGPSLLRRPSAGLMLAGTALLVGLLVTPRVPQHIFNLTGLGRVLWRLTWALPVAPLVGAAAVSIAGARAPAWLRAAPAVALCIVLALTGAPLWARTVGSTITHRAVLKRTGHQVADAHMVLRHTRDGDVVLAPEGLSQTLLVLSGRITTVSPRPFFTRALAAAPGMHAAARLRLQRLAQVGIGPPPALRAGPARVRADLRAVGVDVVCLGRPNRSGRRMLQRLGWRTVGQTHHTACSRVPGG